MSGSAAPSPAVPFFAAGFRLMIVDDDELTREALGLLAEGAGFAVELCASGAEALERLAAGAAPEGVLADMQMPGPAGETFARLARTVCGEGTVMLAMSATRPEAGEIRGYDGFMLKPFAMEQLCAALAGGVAEVEEGAEAVVLVEATYGQLKRSMGADRLRELYRVCVADAEARIGVMRGALAAGDEAVWRRTAHARMGTFGMVGAAELAGVAAGMERGGIPKIDDAAAFAEIVAALGRLRRILDAHHDPG